MGRKQNRLRSPLGSEFPVTGPLSLLADRLLAASRHTAPRLYRILWGLQPRPGVGQQRTTPGSASQRRP